MSTLWTPGGEVPVSDRRSEAGPASHDTPTADAGAAAHGEFDLDSLSPEEREQAEQYIRELTESRERLKSVPASVVVANHAMGLYELAALHLSNQPPNFAEGAVAIDALGALLDGMKGRLGEAEPRCRTPCPRSGWPSSSSRTAPRTRNPHRKSPATTTQKTTPPPEPGGWSGGRALSSHTGDPRSDCYADRCSDSRPRSRVPEDGAHTGTAARAHADRGPDPYLSHPYFMARFPTGRSWRWASPLCRWRPGRAGRGSGC